MTNPLWDTDPEVSQPRRFFLVCALAGATALASIACSGDRVPIAHGPSIVLIIADDLGWGDVGYHGSPIPTPHIDRLAAEGVRLERFYVTPSCVPSRAGIMTGRYPFRYGLDWLPDKHMTRSGLPLEEESIAERLARAGYRHRSAVGKWHLGTDPERYHPLLQGFTSFYGVTGGSVDYFTHRRPKGQHDWYRDRARVFEKGYVTDLLGAEAVRIIEAVPEDESFLLYLAFTAPHGPAAAKPADLARLSTPAMLAALAPYAPPSYISGRPLRHSAYPAMVAALDDQVGAVLDALERRGIAQKTLVWFMSDNGAALAGSNEPYRGGKVSSFEGGIRVPSIVRWPERISGGGSFDGVAAFVDVLPTVAAAADTFLEPRQTLDGIDLLPFLTGAPADPNRAVRPAKGTLVTRDWKLRGSDLYDLRDAVPSEEDVGAHHTKVRARLRARLAELRR